MVLDSLPLDGTEKQEEMLGFAKNLEKFDLSDISL